MKEDATKVGRALTALLGVAVLLSFTLWFVIHQQKVADERWCELMIGLDNRYQSLPASPAPSPEAAELADAIHRLRGKLHCPVGAAPTTTPS